jgi:uncharacterized protein (TIGR03435 family)
LQLLFRNSCLRSPATGAILLLLAPLCGRILAGRPEFEAASIKPNNSGVRPWLAPPVGDRFTATNVTLKLLIPLGWNVPGLGITGGPSWVITQGFDVSTKAPDGVVDGASFRMMMKNLLEERFKLQLHKESRTVPIYVLLPGKNGLKLPNSKAEGCYTGIRDPGVGPQAGCDGMSFTPGSINDERISMAWFSGVLAGVLGRPVIDKTGFAGSFALHLEFAPMKDGESNQDASDPRPSIFAALQEQLGLRLESQKGPAQVLVIDRAERPSEN